MRLSHSDQAWCRTFTIMRLPVFFKQRDNLFYPTWAFVLPTTLVRLPVSFFESLIWVVITYFAVGLTLDASRCALTGCRSDLSYLFQIL